MKQPAFLWRNRHGIYFFRARIPKEFAKHFASSEIKKSLKTDSYREAVKLARACRAALDEVMAKLEKGDYSAFSVTLEGKVKAKLPDGRHRADCGGQNRAQSCHIGRDTSPQRAPA